MTKFTHPDDAPEGHKWQDGKGNKATHVMVIPDVTNPYTIIAVLNGNIETFTKEGDYYSTHSKTQLNLIDAPVEYEVWVNGYKDGAGVAHATRKDADLCIAKSRTSCQKFTIIEGQFDE